MNIKTLRTIKKAQTDPKISNSERKETRNILVDNEVCKARDDIPSSQEKQNKKRGMTISIRKVMHVK
jgi:hypothetical protein